MSCFEKSSKIEGKLLLYIQAHFSIRKDCLILEIGAKTRFIMKNDFVEFFPGFSFRALTKKIKRRKGKVI